MEILGNGIWFGLMLAVFVGPVFFALIQTNIDHGFKSGIAMALGICLSDFTCIVISYIGISQILESESLKAMLSIAGGGIMLTFGLSSFRKPIFNKSIVCSEEGSQKLWRYTFKGFLLNGINPFVLLFWLGVVSYSSVEYKYAGNEATLFFGTILLTVLITDLIKSFMAHQLRSFITERYMIILNRAVGVVLVAFAVKLFYTGFVN